MFALELADFEETPSLASDLEERLTATAPGAALAAILEAINREDLEGSDRVAMMQARARLLSHVQAELSAAMVSVGQSVDEAIGEHDVEHEADEVRAALVLTRRAAEDQMTLALTLLESFPRLWHTLWTGLLDAPRVRVILESVAGLDQELTDRVVAEVLPIAPGMTTGQLRARLAKLVIASDPQAAAYRYEEAVRGRRVWAGPNTDGTAGLFGLDLPADRVAAAMRRIHELANGLKSTGDDRTADQVRADLFLELLCGEKTELSLRQATVDLRVDLTTLAGLDENPGEIPGWGPVIADVARKVAKAQKDSSWRVTVSGREGEVVWIGTTKRRPSAAMRRYLEVSRQTCVFPGCRMPASDSDIDHNQAWADGGLTDPWNLAPLCRHDHCLKHRAGWSLEQIKSGTWRWTSPLGRVYEVTTAPP
ncbi:HNH endonuclease signature motif containing protein [soil metagenome]